MSSGPAVIVNKGGFLSATAKGLFGTIMVVVACGTALGLYGLRMVDTHFTSITNQVGTATEKILDILPEWQKMAPPQIAEALNDRRAVDYRDALKIAARIAKVDRRGAETAVVLEVTNGGSEIVTLLPLRVVVEDQDGTPVSELSVYAATPIMICDEWRGPLLPGSGTRKFVVPAHGLHGVKGDLKATVEITDLRVARPALPAAPAPAPAATPAAAPAPAPAPAPG
jgi:hypothetical protein